MIQLLFTLAVFLQRHCIASSRAKSIIYICRHHACFQRLHSLFVIFIRSFCYLFTYKVICFCFCYHSIFLFLLWTLVFCFVTNFCLTQKSWKGAALYCATLLFAFFSIRSPTARQRRKKSLFMRLTNAYKRLQKLPICHIIFHHFIFTVWVGCIFWRQLHLSSSFHLSIFLIFIFVAFAVCNHFFLLISCAFVAPLCLLSMQFLYVYCNIFHLFFHFYWILYVVCKCWLFYLL